MKTSDFHPDLQHLVPQLYRYQRWVMLPGLLRLYGWWRRYCDIGRNIAGLDCATDYLKSSLDGADIRVRIYRPSAAADVPLPCMLYIHGGGYLIGSPEGADEVIKRFIDRRPCVVIAPDYRKAYDRPFPAGFQDCYDTLLWARDQAERLGCRSDTFMVGGHSAGGGLTAAVSLKARDTGDVSIAFQMPFYPMIDDTQPEDDERDIAPPVWSSSLNRKGWAGYHADIRRGRADMSAYAAPMRAESFAGLPPTLTFVGDLEPFYWETETYVERLREAGVDVRYRCFSGCYHAFELIGDGGQVARDARAFTVDTYAQLYDTYL
jgi:acetyl esterase/lipase